MIERRCVVALDVGGTKISCGLFQDDGRMLYQKTAPTSQESADASVAQLVSFAGEAVSNAPKDAVAAGVGVVVPGWVNQKTRTVWAPNINGWDHIPLEQMLSDALPLPIILDSDRSGYVKGEAWLGVARGLSDVIFLAVGTGIGAGILVNRQVIHGHDDLAGAVGWFALNPQFQEVYSRMGCFEAEASGSSVGRKGREALDSAFLRNSTAQVTARDVLEAALTGDLVALDIVSQAALYIGMGAANLISTLNPQMIVLGGGMFQSGSLLFEMVRRECMRWAQPIAAPRTRIELSALGERAGLAGAARIALDNI
jgi:glucokinase